MSTRICSAPLGLSELLAYWLAEIPEASAAHLESHLFACDACSARLARLAHLTGSIRGEARDGRLSSVVSASFIQRLRDTGLRVREYRLHPGGSVNCTVAPEDDLVVAHLHAPLASVRRLDVIIEDVGGATYRLQDVAFDAAAEEIVIAPSVAELRELGVATRIAALVSVTDDAEHVIGRYTFNHSPHG